MLSVDVILYNDLIWSSALQVGSLIAITAFTTALGRGRALVELGKSSSFRTYIESTRWLGNLIYYWTRYAVPLIIALILVYGWYSWFTS